MDNQVTFFEVYINRTRILFQDLHNAVKCARKHGSVVREITEDIVFNPQGNSPEIKVVSKFRNGKYFQHSFTQSHEVDRYISDFLSCDDAFTLTIYKVV